MAGSWLPRAMPETMAEEQRQPPRTKMAEMATPMEATVNRTALDTVMGNPIAVVKNKAATVLKRSDKANRATLKTGLSGQQFILSQIQWTRHCPRKEPTPKTIPPRGLTDVKRPAATAVAPPMKAAPKATLPGDHSDKG